MDTITSFAEDLFKTAYVPPNFVNPLKKYLSGEFGTFLSELGPKKAENMKTLILDANNRNQSPDVDKSLKKVTSGNAELFEKIDEWLVTLINSYRKRLGLPLETSILENNVNEKRNMTMSDKYKIVLPKKAVLEDVKS